MEMLARVTMVTQNMATVRTGSPKEGWSSYIQDTTKERAEEPKCVQRSSQCKACLISYIILYVTRGCPTVCMCMEMPAIWYCRSWIHSNTSTHTRLHIFGQQTACMCLSHYQHDLLWVLMCCLQAHYLLIIFWVLMYCNPSLTLTTCLQPCHDRI